MLSESAQKNCHAGPALTIVPATAERWADFEALMGPKGGVGGCWCMLWRQSQKIQEAQKGAGNRKKMKRIFGTGRPPGLLAFDGDTPIAWLSIAPRAEFVRLEGSRILKPVDAEPVWSISCFLIRRDYRRKGVAVALLDAAKRFVADQGGAIIEGYPVEPRKDPYPGTYAWTGIAESFRRAGFTEVARRSETRPIMRFSVRGGGRQADQDPEFPATGGGR